MKIKTIDAHLYREVFCIVEWRNGYIFKTKTTGKFVHKDRKLDDKLYITVAISTKITATSADELSLPEFDE